MSFDLKKALNSVSAAIGVNAGYTGEAAAVKDPVQAAEQVRLALEAVEIEGVTYPGRVVYKPDWGCPDGGEAVGTVFVAASGISARDLLEKFERVRQNLKQTTLSVITSPDMGISMPGFVVDFGDADMQTLGRQWQNAADQNLAENNIYISGMLYQADGHVYGQAEANPTRITDPAAWTDTARKLIERIQKGAEPVFRDVGYHYLRAPQPPG